MVQYIVKRNGEKVSFDAKKIRNAIFKANIRIAAERMSDADLDSLTAQVSTLTAQAQQAQGIIASYKEIIKKVKEIVNA